jgi:hypothetical protein
MTPPDPIAIRGRGYTTSRIRLLKAGSSTACEKTRSSRRPRPLVPDGRMRGTAGFARVFTHSLHRGN